MSLRERVITLVALVLLVSLSVYIAMAWVEARQNFEAELAAARTGGLQTVRSAFEDLPRSDHQARDLRHLVATFDESRHLRASLLDRSGRLRLESVVARPRSPAPNWFAASFGSFGRPLDVAVPGVEGGILRLRPEPANDIAALWKTSRNAVGLFAVAAATAFALIYWVIGRALAPLGHLARGLDAIGAGGYRERVCEEGTRELLSLQRGFNKMAERLSEIDARNRSLEAQLLTIQDEERAEIARDLHDEIGPHLFAVALDAQMIERSLQEGQISFVPEQVRSIQSAVSYMQVQVRDLIARLRPTQAAELGLEAALGDLVAFCRSRQPDVEFETELAGADTFVPQTIRDVIYRVVQEAVANALKHAVTRRVSVAVIAPKDATEVIVRNAGQMKAIARTTPGLGLLSMRERVQAAHGTLRIEQADEGWTVVARFARAGETGIVRCAS